MQWFGREWIFSSALARFWLGLVALQLLGLSSAPQLLGLVAMLRPKAQVGSALAGSLIGFAQDARALAVVA